MAYFNPYYNSNRYNSQSYTPCGYTNNYKPTFGYNNTIPQGAEVGDTKQVGGIDQATTNGFNLGNTGQQVGQSVGGKLGAGVAIAGAGLNAYEQGVQSADGFSVDANAGLKGAASGAAAGSAAGPWGTLIGAVVGTVAGSVGSVKGVNDNIKNLNTGVQGVAYDANDNPSYQGLNVLNASNNSKGLTAGIKSIYDTPDITGTRWIGEAIFNTRKKAREKRKQLELGIQNAQANYNTAETANRQNNISQQDYANSLNQTNRMYNLYNTSA